MSRKALRKSAARRSMPIHAYTGANGGGKSLLMVHDTLPSLERGRPVLSTVRLLDYRNPRPCPSVDVCDQADAHFDVAGNVHRAAHPLYVPFRHYEQLVEWEAGDVLMDEVTGVASSRESQSMPAPVANYLVQLRRNDVALRWTSPNWSRADVIIRQVTGLVTYCSGYFPESIADDENARLWRPRRVFMFRTFDAAAFDEFTAHKRETLRSAVRQLSRRSKMLAQDAYDTLAPVHSLGFANDHGSCMTCGGMRAKRRCECDTPVISSRPKGARSSRAVLAAP